MAIRCAWFRLTLYPSDWPDESGGVVLVGDDTHIDESTSLVGELAQMVQRSERVRASAPDLYVRGNRSTTLDWEEVRLGVAPHDATAAAMDALESMPDTTGWLLLELPDLGRRWVFAPAAVESAGWSHQPRDRQLRLRWRIPAGPAVEVAAEAADDRILDERGYPILTEDGYEIALETAS